MTRSPGTFVVLFVTFTHILLLSSFTYIQPPPYVKVCNFCHFLPINLEYYMLQSLIILSGTKNSLSDFGEGIKRVRSIPAFLPLISAGGIQVILLSHFDFIWNLSFGIWI
jgi:hypothetical protein